LKIVLLFTALIILSGFAFYQTDTEESYFIVTYSTGENWDPNKEPHEQDHFNDHSSHLGDLRKSEKIKLGGRYGDKGMIILIAKDEEEAKSLIFNDPAIKNKLFKAELHPFYHFYSGCVE